MVNNAARSDGSGRSEALDRMFTRTQAELLTYFSRRLGDPELAAEHAQDTFLRFARMGYSAASTEARAILFGIARNLFTDHLRKRRRQRAQGFSEPQPIDPELLDEHTSSAACPERTLSARQELENVLAAIEELPSKCRRVFIMHRLHGRSHKDIARELGITLSMVEKHIMEATARLMKVKT